MEGRAVIGGQEVVRSAAPADDMTQAFAYKHLVPATELTVAIADSPNPWRVAGAWAKNNDMAKGPDARRPNYRPTPTITLLDKQPARIPVGGTAEVRIAAPGFFGRTEIQIELSDPPEGIAVANATQADQGLTILLRGDAQKVKAGLKGNLIASAFSKTTWKTQDGKPQTTRWLVATLPAIPFEIVEPRHPPGR